MLLRVISTSMGPLQDHPLGPVMRTSESSLIRTLILTFSILILLAGCAEEQTKPVPSDDVSPARIDDIEILHSTTTTITFRWTATGDDGISGKAAAYDIRYSRGYLHDEEDWESAKPVEDPPAPREAGVVEEYTITGLEENAFYTIAIKAVDDEGLVSPLSPLTIAYTAREEDARWWDSFAEFPDGQGIGTVEGRDRVICMVVHDDRLVVAGSFHRAGDIATESIAEWDGDSWSALGSGVPGTVLAMTSYGGDLIVGGSFPEAGGTPAVNVARWNGSGWSPLGDGLPGSVRTLAVHDGALFAGGSFTCEGGTTNCPVWKWDGAWSAVDSVGLDRVAALASFGGYLYAGGIRSTLETWRFITRWDGGSWEVFLSTEPAPTWLDPGLREMRALGDRLIVHGDLLPVSRLSAWDGSAWSDLPFPGYVDPLIGGGIAEIGEYAEVLVAGGSFQGPPNNHLAWWDGSGWRQFGSGVRTWIRDFGWVGAVAEYRGALYVGGGFLYAGEKRSLNIARWSE